MSIRAHSQDEDSARPNGWRQASKGVSLPEAHASVPIPQSSFWRKLAAFSGPGVLVAVGYMDPGNWATDLDGGAKFGYQLLSVVLISNFMAILLQHLALKLGIVTGRDLAQACRDHYSRRVGIALWVFCEIAIAACDLAEVIGCAIALKLLCAPFFNLPLVVGVAFTALDVMLVLLLQNKGFRRIEAIVMALMLVIAGCFVYEILLARPAAGEVLWGFVPTSGIVMNREMNLIAVGILGATVMPHNLYLHSSIVQTRAYERNDEGKAMAIRFATLDSTLALSLAFFINAAILIVAAKAFHGQPGIEEIGIEDAPQMLVNSLGTSLSGVCFAIALLASGQNSTLTGTMAGQIVMEGFLDLRLRPWVRRMITRLIAIVPAIIVTYFAGDDGAERLLVLSQVILALQLSFAVVPLVHFTSQPSKMGRFANRPWLRNLSWTVAVVIILLDLVYLVTQVLGHSAS
jgi:manganese transport protein